MTATDPSPYKTLIRGTLIQRTAFSTGGHDPHDRVDAPVARDGDDRLTLRGSALAGAFIADAARLYLSTRQRNASEPPEIGTGDLGRITTGPPTAQARLRREAKERTQKGEDPNLPRLPESAWRFYHSHPCREPALEVRSGVGIRQDTGAAAENLKYEVETVPAGTRWPFLLEIDDYRDPDAAAIALHVIEQWQKVCLLGRNVARGLGWMRLDKTSLEILRLKPEHHAYWPNAEKAPGEAFEEVRARCPVLPPDQREELKATKPPTQSNPGRILGEGRISIEPGKHLQTGKPEDIWGLDTLSVGASEAQRPTQAKALQQLSARHPAGKDQPNPGRDQPPADNLNPDIVLAWTTPANGKAPRPFIPGSGLRGPLRHALSWWQRSRCGESVLDPNLPKQRDRMAKKERIERDAIEALFGTPTHAGALLIADAEWDEEQAGAFTDDAILFLEQHAEDEFTAGTYAQAKFNRLALLRGCFRFQYLIESDDPKRPGEARELLAQAAALGALRQIPIGGANWRGHGWVRWEIELPELPNPPSAADAGDPKPTPNQDTDR